MPACLALRVFDECDGEVQVDTCLLIGRLVRDAGSVVSDDVHDLSVHHCLEHVGVLGEGAADAVGPFLF